MRFRIACVGPIAGSILIAAVIALSACRSQDNPPVDLLGEPDLSVVDIAGLVDLSGVDFTKLPDLVNADLYTPLFKAPVPYSAENGPIYIATADLNKDGKRDLIVANTNNPPATSSTVNVLLGNGDGTFQTKLSTNVDASPRALAVSDLNGDTFPDVVVAVGDGFEVLLGSVTGALGTPTKTAIATTYIGSIALGDVDGDGHVDAVLSDLGVITGKAWVSRGDGLGGFATPVSFEVTASVSTVYSTVCARLGDMNNDGKIDIVTANSKYTGPGADTIAILTNTSTPGTVSMSGTPTELTAGSTPIDLLVAQLDNANKLDIVFANLAGNTVSVFLSNTATSALTFATAASYPAPGNPTALAFGDIDADSKVDILTANAQNSTVTVLYGGGGGLFGQATMNRPGSESYPTGANPTSLVAATFNADVKVDVATADDGAGTVSVLINQR